MIDISIGGGGNGDKDDLPTQPVADSIINQNGDSIEYHPDVVVPTVTREQIRNCSVSSWLSRYSYVTGPTRLLGLNGAFVKYLRADGIVLPLDSGIRWWKKPEQDEDDEDDKDDGDGDGDVTAGWETLHCDIAKAVSDLGGVVRPKLNWSAPKDATWMSLTKTMDCHSAADIYMLLKASDFVTRDLDDPFAGAQDEDGPVEIDYHLALRKSDPEWNPAMEFRCFVRNRSIVGISQRDPNFYQFLFRMRPMLERLIETFFETHLKDSFPDDSFAFDVYVRPAGSTGSRVWLVDINPWAAHTDTLLFDWPELMNMADPVRPADGTGSSVSSDDDDVDTDLFDPFFRLVRKSDPESYNFSSSQYSAQRVPIEVVEAASGQSGGSAMAEFTAGWFREMQRQEDLRRLGKTDDETDSD